MIFILGGHFSDFIYIIGSISIINPYKIYCVSYSADHSGYKDKLITLFST